jgi:hypothetical protein
MSETTEQAEGGAQPPEPTTQQDNQPQANDNQPEANDNQQTEDEKRQAQSREDRRIAQLTARLAAERRERERLQGEAEAWRQRQMADQQPQGAEETDEQREQRITAAVEAKIRREQFHQDGEAAYGQAVWRQKCDDVISMGADPGFAALLVEMPDRVKITAALAEDPEAVQRIASIRSERGRAIALGRYAAGLDRPAAANTNGAAHSDSTPTPAAAPRVTAAPAPVRPVEGRTQPSFDPYNPRHTPEQLFDFFARQEKERRSGQKR